MQTIINLFIHLILLSAGLFGLYASSRLIALKKTHALYVVWLFSHSIMFLMYFFIQNGTFDSHPFLYRTFTPLYFIAPACLYLFFVSINKDKKIGNLVWIHSSPVIVLSIIAFIQVYFYREHLLNNIKEIQAQIHNPNQPYIHSPFRLEKLLFAIRSILAVFYVRMIDKLLPREKNNQLNQSWYRIFKPIRINVYLVLSVFIPHQIIQYLFQIDIGQFYFINLIIIVAAFMFFWHLLLLLKDFESPNSIFKMRHVEKPAALNIPEKSLFILHQIYQEKLYLDPMLSIGKVANKFGIAEEKFSLLFNNTIPFSFSSYINYLRLLNFKNISNDKFSKEANIANAGFNSRASYYQWEKRQQKLAIQINPFLESILHKGSPIS